MPTQVPPIQSQTQKGFLSLQLVTQACHGVLNTTFSPPDPKPSWFDDLNAHLDAAKAVATDWIDNIAPALTASVPQAVLDYGTTYQAITTQIIQICDANPTASGADNVFVKQVHDLVGGLIDQVQSNLSTVDTMSSQLKAWGDRLQKAHDDLSSGVSSIQNAETALTTDIAQMGDAITALKADTDALNKLLMDMEITVGVGIFVGVVALALAPVTVGGSLVVGAIAVAAIVGGAVEWSLTQKKINADFSQISADQDEITTDKAQIVALQGLATSASQAIDNMTTAETSLSDFRTSWASFHDDLQGVITDLTKADKALNTLREKVFTNAAGSEWALAINFATTLQGLPVSVPVVQMDMSGKITSQAA